MTAEEKKEIDALIYELNAQIYYLKQHMREYAMSQDLTVERIELGKLVAERDGLMKQLEGFE